MYKTKVTKVQVGEHTKQITISTESHKTVEKALRSYLENFNNARKEAEEGEIQYGYIELYDKDGKIRLLEKVENV